MGRNRALADNGTVHGDVNAYYGSMIKGSGFFDGLVMIYDGAKFSPGTSSGTVTASYGGFAPGGTYVFEMNDATGVSGVDMDLWNIVNDLNISAGNTDNSRFTIQLSSLDALGNPAWAANFDPTRTYSWTLVHTGSGIEGFSPDRFSVDSSGFLNPTQGTFVVTEMGNDLVLVYSGAPVPLPTALPLAGGLLGVVMAGGGWRSLRKKMGVVVK